MNYYTLTLNGYALLLECETYAQAMQACEEIGATFQGELDEQRVCEFEARYIKQ